MSREIIQSDLHFEAAPLAAALQIELGGSGVLGGYRSPAAGHIGESTGRAGRLDGERRGRLAGVELGLLVPGPCPLHPEGTREPLQALGRERRDQIGV